jgi:hypothetical protein
MSAGHRASLCSLVGVGAFRLLWFGAFFRVSVAVLAWLLGEPKASHAVSRSELS